MGYGVALCMQIPLYTVGQKSGFWIPRMGVFEMRDAIKILGFSRVVLNAHIPMYMVGQKLYFWMRGMCVFEMHLRGPGPCYCPMQ